MESTKSTTVWPTVEGVIGWLEGIIGEQSEEPCICVQPANNQRETVTWRWQLATSWSPWEIKQVVHGGLTTKEVWLTGWSHCRTWTPEAREFREERNLSRRGNGERRNPSVPVQPEWYRGTEGKRQSLESSSRPEIKAGTEGWLKRNSKKSM